MPVAFHKLTFRYMRKLSHSNVLRKYMYCDRKGISPFKHGCALLPYVFLNQRRNHSVNGQLNNQGDDLQHECRLMSLKSDATCL